MFNCIFTATGYCYFLKNSHTSWWKLGLTVWISASEADPSEVKYSFEVIISHGRNISLCKLSRETITQKEYIDATMHKDLH